MGGLEPLTETLAESAAQFVQQLKPKLRGWLHLVAFPLTVVAGIVLVALAPAGRGRVACAVFAVWLAVRAVSEAGLDRRPTPMTMEEFISGHEGFYDTLTCNGAVVYEGICHYYPNVLEAMRTRELSPQILITNRMDASGYEPLRALGRRVIDTLGLSTAATHMEWFFGPRGLTFSEIGARPPACRLWDLYNYANDFDLYRAWAEAVALGRTAPQPSRRYAAGMISLRPNRDGRVKGYEGLDEIQKRYGPSIVKAHLPPPGSPTQPIEAGYLANAWVWARHTDYDQLRAMMDDIGATIQVLAG